MKEAVSPDTVIEPAAIDTGPTRTTSPPTILTYSLNRTSSSPDPRSSRASSIRGGLVSPITSIETPDAAGSAFPPRSKNAEEDSAALQPSSWHRVECDQSMPFCSGVSFTVTSFASGSAADAPPSPMVPPAPLHDSDIPAGAVLEASIPSLNQNETVAFSMSTVWRPPAVSLSDGAWPSPTVTVLRVK